ncbi:MAG: hypothetical protein K2M96_10760 [Prevotella sp.]|nr:hypothetical protein [Prevotella sp.]
MKQQLLKALFMCMAVAFLPQVARAAGDVEINAKNFPDENFRNYLLQQDYGKDGKLTEEEIKDITSLDVPYKRINSLQGIEYFTALTELNCVYNQLTSLDVSKNIALTELNCGYNSLTSLDVSKNTALTGLWCGENQLTSLDVSKNTALTGLFCYKNQLTALDVLKNTALTELNCVYNSLTSLDVSKNTALTELYCGSNPLTVLDVSKNTALSKLDCYDNQLTALDVSMNTALTRLYCTSNQLTSLDVSKNTALTGLFCYNNQLTSLDVSKNTALTELWCYNNQLTSLDVSKNTALTELYCSVNQIKGASMDNLINSLPINNTDKPSKFYVYDTQSSDEGNVCTKKQVQVAKGKGWKVYYYDYSEWNWLEYEGSDDTSSVADGIKTEAGKDAPVYNLRGERLTAPQKGVNIIGGRKVVVK